MIYKNNKLIEWDKPSRVGRQAELTADEKEVYGQITAIRNEFFADDTLKSMILLYPKGEPKEVDRGWTQLKKFAIPLKGKGGTWRYTESLRNVEKKSNQGYADHHKYIQHQTALEEKDIEFIWFLKHQSPVLGKSILFEDLEGDAKKEIEELASDADIRFMIMSNKSPIANNPTLLKEVASVFGVENVDKIGVSQIKKELYDTLLNGQEYGDSFTNYETFDKLVSGEKARKAAYISRCAIENNVVGYKQNAWWIMDGRDYGERLVVVPAKEGNMRDQVLIQAVVENDNVRSRVFSVMGEDENVTLEDLRAWDRPVLQKKYKELTGQFLNIKKEEIIEKLCEHYDIEFSSLLAQ